MSEELKRSSQHKESFINGIWKQNPLFVSILGTCPALAVTTSFESSFGMGILFTFVLTCSNIIISALRKVIPDEARTPCYIVVIAAFVTLVKMFTEAFIPELYSSLGVFLSLLVVNCIVLGRAEAFANKNTVLDSTLDGLGNGIGYTLAISILGLVREILGTGLITIGKIFTFIPYIIRIPVLSYYNPTTQAYDFDYSMPIFSKPAGAFVVLGIVIAIITAVSLHKSNVEKALKKKEQLALMAEKKKAAEQAKLKAAEEAKIKASQAASLEGGK